MCRNQQLASPQAVDHTKPGKFLRSRRRLCGCVPRTPPFAFLDQAFPGPRVKPRRGFLFCGPSAKWSARHTPPWQASAVFTAAKNAENAEVLPRSTQSFVGARAARKAQRTTRRREDKTTGNPPLHPLGIRGRFLVVPSACRPVVLARANAEAAEKTLRGDTEPWVGRALRASRFASSLRPSALFALDLAQGLSTQRRRGAELPRAKSATSAKPCWGAGGPPAAFSEKPATTSRNPTDFHQQEKEP